MVEQLGLAWGPLGADAVERLRITSGTTSGVLAVTKFGVLSMTGTRPRARGTCSRDTAAPAENREVALREVKALQFLDRVVAPAKHPRPTERSLASCRCATEVALLDTLTIASPTRPVAPTTATLNCLSMRSISCGVRGGAAIRTATAHPESHGGIGDPGNQPRGA
jgi:hypothetical protein